MEKPKRKMPLFLVGVIALFAIAIIGIIVDFAADFGGTVAIASVLVAFVVFAIFIIIDVIRRRVAEKRAEKHEVDSQSQFNVPAEQRFLRHSEQTEAPLYTPDQSYGSYDDGFADSFDDSFDDSTPASHFANPASESPSMVLRRRAAALRAAQEGTLPDIENTFDSFSSPAPADSNVTDTSAAIYDDEAFAAYADDGFGPYSDGIAETGAESAEYPDDEANEPQLVPDEIPTPEVDYTVSQPASDIKPASAAMTTGQTLESFYADMSEDDILYRDCVEVWAADTKPSVIRLMKLVEELEDKKAQVRFGRELEYVNAMLDRISYFTQLEYVDELLELEEHNFATLVKECLKRFSPFFMEKKLGLLWKGLDVNVMTDKRWFIFALTQVIFNSVEFTPDGGKIAISAKKSDDYIDLMIDDSGKGVSPDELPCVFIAGYMGDESPNEEGRRTGMGLFIAQSVLRKMGGDAFIESNYGKGTRVTLRVPAIKPTAEKTAAKQK